MNRREMPISGARFLGAGAVLLAAGDASPAEKQAAQTQPPLLPPSGQQYNPVVTLNGSTCPWKIENGVKIGEFVAEAPGEWVLRCHKSHHTMNAMGHDVPNLLGVDQRDLANAIQSLVPQYMAMGQDSMAEHAAHSAMGHMALPENTIPMMTGKGPFGPIEMGGMFTTVKIREHLAAGDYRDPGWYEHPQGTLPYKLA
jgi:hypothetical protein